MEYQKENQTERHYLDSESPQLPEWIKTLDFYLSNFYKQKKEAQK